MGNIQVQWVHHQCEVGGDIRTLRSRVGVFRRTLLLEFRQHQTSYIPHVLNAVNMKSQFDIYFIIRKVFPNRTCSKLNQVMCKVHPCTSTEALYRVYGP